MLICPDSSGVKAIQMLLRKFYPKSSFVPTTAEKDSKKIMEMINRLFYTSDISKLQYHSEFRHVFHLCKFYITLALLIIFYKN